MLITVERKWKKANYTIGRLYIDGEFFCNTLEDTDRGLDSSMLEKDIKAIKVKDKTAIPTGKYKVSLDTQSPKYSKKKYYKDLCDGYLPRLLDVKGFSGVLIHCGNSAEDSSGCILVGMNTVKGKLTDSQKTFTKLYAILLENKDNIEIEII